MLDFAKRFFLESQIETWASLALIGLVLERLIQPGLKARANSTWLNIRYGVIYALAIFVITPSLGICLNYIRQKTGTGFINLDYFSVGIVQQCGAAILLIIITDFFYYWLHRAQHTFGWLWHQHVVHHSDEALNATTAARHNWLEFVFQALAVSLPMSIFFKLSPINIWFISSFVGAYGWFIHANVKIGFGRLSWLACSPQLHRIHHSTEPQHSDKNFAAYFPVWDVLFGTYYAPAKNEYPPTGVKGVEIKTVTKLATYPFSQWLSAVRGLLRSVVAPLRL
jgi:sterol desaturase/sphingolipid hydroxylase (fatty acid hydroxylase superfamily)